MRYRVMCPKQNRYLVNSVMDFLVRLLNEEGKSLEIIIVFPHSFRMTPSATALSTEMGDKCERQVGEPFPL